MTGMKVLVNVNKSVVMEALGEKQRQAIYYVQEGHNIAVLGQSGTGKSTVLREIHRILKDKRNIAVTASTGIASCNFNDIGGQTLHRWSGIQDGRYQNDILVHKLETDVSVSSCRDNILQTDILIIDEISMVSVKTFQQLEYICRRLRKRDIPFGGIQVVVAGDFLQLPPVPNPLLLDDGKYCFKSDIWQRCMTHIITLDIVMRQDELDLINAIHDVSQGTCSEDSKNLFERLHRNLPPGEEPLRLCARNFDVDVYNAEQVLKQPSENLKVFTAKDTGETGHLKRLTVPKKLALKPNCPVLLLRNLSDKLVNGLRGFVESITDDTITVNFDGNSVTVNQMTFTVYNALLDKVVASRTQFPLSLAYATTIHKAQSLTLERLEVDCTAINTPGQFGVAVGRAKCKKGLKIINFDPACIRMHDKDVYQITESSKPYISKLTCCREVVLVDQPVDIQGDIAEDGSEISDFSEGEINEIIRLEQSATVQLPDISNIELFFDPKEVLQSLKPQAPENEFTVKMTKIIDNICSTYTEQLTFFTRSLVSKMTELLEKHCGNLEERKSAPKQWSLFLADLYAYSTSSEYSALLKILFGDSPSDEACNVSSKLYQAVQEKVIQKSTASVTAVSQESPMSLSPSHLSVGAKGKVRYIAGRCVAKARFHQSSIVSSHLYDSKKKMAKETALKKINILDSFIVRQSVIQETSKFKDTLIETKRLQNLNEGLTNISDELFEIFLMLEAKRSAIQTFQLLEKEGENVLSHVQSSLLANQDIQSRFALMCGVTYQSESVYSDVLKDLIERYCRVSDNQFRKDYLAHIKAEKSERLRVKVLKQKKSSLISGSRMPFAEILKDTSIGKKKSHFKLMSAILDVKEDAFGNYKKPQLKMLCSAYNIQFGYKDSNLKLAERLVQSIPNYQEIPSIQEISVQTSSGVVSEESTSSQSASFVGPCAEELAPRLSKHKQKHVAVAIEKKLSSKKRKTKQSGITVTALESTICPICSKLYHEGEEWVCCDSCDTWVDRTCAGLVDEVEWRKVSKEDEPWKCSAC